MLKIFKLIKKKYIYIERQKKNYKKLLKFILKQDNINCKLKKKEKKCVQ